MLLEAAGIEVSLFEAIDRAGGRLWTVSDENGPQYDLGGEWIDADHLRCLDLIRELGAQPREATGNSLVRYKDEIASENSLWGDVTHDITRIESHAAEMAAEIRREPYANETNLAIGKRPLSSFLDETCESERGRWYAEAYYRSDEGDDTENIGLHGWLCGYLNYIGRVEGTLSAFRFAGGAGSFFSRALATICAQPQYDHVLASVEQSTSAVTLTFENGNIHRCDRALIAIPPKCLREIQFSPPLRNEMHTGLDSIGMGRIVKAALRFSAPFWESVGWNGSMLFDSPAQQTWLGSLGSDPILMAYVCGGDTQQLLTSDYPLQSILSEIVKVFPEANDCFVGGQYYDWTRHPYSLGGFSHIPPTMDVRELSALREPHGRVHFAGEHTANWLGFIEGALESAERATDELLA